jgi:hypothetical protein
MTIAMATMPKSSGEMRRTNTYVLTNPAARIVQRMPIINAEPYKRCDFRTVVSGWVELWVILEVRVIGIRNANAEG